MRVCYLDESGDLGTLQSATDEATTPVFVLAGVSLPARALARLTQDYLHLATRFGMGQFGPAAPWLDRIRHIDVDGQKVRRAFREEDRRRTRRFQAYLWSVLQLLEDSRARLYGRIVVKAVGARLSTGVYPGLLLDIATDFHRELEAARAPGLLVLDARDSGANEDVVHTVFTQKHKSRGGDAFPRLQEVPLFGKPQNHAGLRIADLLASALLFPASAHAYAADRVQTVHTHAGYARVRAAFGVRLLRFPGVLRVKPTVAGRWLPPAQFRLG